MGQACYCCAPTEDGNFDANVGIEDECVFEKFQYHRTKMYDYSIKPSAYDMFYREACHPLYLLTLKEFN